MNSVAHEVYCFFQQNDEDVQSKMAQKLASWPCRNQGFVLDGYPLTLAQSRSLFTESVDFKAPAVPEVYFPEFVISLEADDSFLQDRVLNMDQSEITPDTEEQG